jgi:hygromycin-B 7''-O-kinase
VPVEDDMLKLPASTDAAGYSLHFNDAVWNRAASAVCARHGLFYESLRRSPRGENIIFLVDRRLVIKIFAPFRDNYSREAAALEYVRGKLGLETPELVHAGELDGWPYLVMTQLQGRASREVWEGVPSRDRLEILSRLGAAMRELHAHAAPLRTALDRDWQRFIERQARDAVERQRARDANPEWLESLPAYVAERLELLPSNQGQVFLHGDIHAGNMLLAEEGGRWQIKGLIDFGDSLCGFHEYEFVAPGVLMAQGDAELQRAMLLAYGYAESQLDQSLRARLMLLTVLYECSDLRKYALRLAPEAVSLTLSELESAIWKFAPG